MRAPRFWWFSKKSLPALLLSPCAAIYRTIVHRRLKQKGEKVSIPVLCVGNFIVGGAGKTPTAIALKQILQEQGYQCAFLSRGYGGNLSGPVLVDAKQHNARDVGDEPLLLCEYGMTIVSRNRLEGARFCEKNGAELIIMDDGMQNPSLHKDIVLAVTDSRGIGNGLCLPAGPLRADIEVQLRNVDAIIAVDRGQNEYVFKDLTVFKNHPRFMAKIIPDRSAAEQIRGKRIIVIAGIGNPAKFHETLKQCGAHIAKHYDFADHHPFSLSELQKIMEEAEKESCPVYTTTKDYVRMKSVSGFQTLKDRIMPFPVELVFYEQKEFLDFLLKKIDEKCRDRLKP